MADIERDEITREEMWDRIVIARSVLGHAPAYRAIRKALGALEGATYEELQADQDVSQEPPPGPREYLRGWHDGWDSGYTTAVERHGTAA